MFIKEPRSFYDSAKPIIYLNFIVGMGAYRQPNMSDRAYFFMQVYTIIVNLSKCITAYFGLTEMMSTTWYSPPDSSFARSLFRILIPINFGMAAISPFFLWLQMRRLKDCIRQLPNFDDTFRDILGVRNDYKEQYISLISHVIVLVLLTASVAISDTLWISEQEGRPWQEQIAFLSFSDYPLIVILVLDLNFCICVRYLQKRFRDLNDGLLKMAKKSPSSHGNKGVSVISRQVLEVRPGLQMNDMKAESSFDDNLYLLREIRKMYLELCKLSRKTNVAFGMQNLLSMGTSFAMLTLLTYVAYGTYTWRDLQLNNFVMIMSTISWISVYVSKIWIVNHSCWNLKNETERTGDVIHELLVTRADEEFQKEIQEFAVQITQNPVRFDACGFFILDHTFVQGVIGSVTTYLVILIQMGHVQ